MATANELGVFIADEVKRAEVIFDSYRSRSTGVIAVSTGVVGIATGLIAVAAGDEKDVLPPDGAQWVTTALMFFALATLLALLIHVPVKLKAADDHVIEGYVRENWDDSGWDKSIADQQLTYLKSLHEANRRFGRLMILSLVAQLLAVVATVVLAAKIVEHVT